METILRTRERKGDMDFISVELRQLLESIGIVRKMKADSYLFREGMDAHELFLIKDGIVQVGKITSEGKELTLRICKKDDIVGELILFHDSPTYMLSAKILTDGEVLIIDKDKLENELVKNGQLAVEVMKWVSTHMRKFQSKIHDLLLNGKKGALYSTLIRLGNSYGVETKDGILIDIVLTNQELGNFCAATRESVNRMLGDLRKRNVISIDDLGKITLKNVSYIRKEIGCEYCPIDICNID